MELDLPELIELHDFDGNYDNYVNAVYQIFYQDYVIDKVKYKGEVLRLKWHPEYQGRAYTFYHITHKGRDENNRIPDLRRCERIGWGKPLVENCEELNLKVWPQTRKGKNRICIWLDLDGEPDYIIILDIRKNYKLLWTTFVLNYPHEKRKKLKEYNAYLDSLKN